MKKESIEDFNRRRDNRRAIGWVLALLACGSFIAFMVFTVVGQYYLVDQYLIVVLITTGATIALAWLWWYMATSDTGFRVWVTTQTIMASLLFILLSIVIAAASYAYCHIVYTPDHRNFLTLDVICTLPALFTLLMYARPPLGVEDTILPGGGIGQTVARGVIAVLMVALIVWRFLYNF